MNFAEEALSLAKEKPYDNSIERIRRRTQVVQRMQELRISNSLLAMACDAAEPSLRKWKNGGHPGKNKARLALDRLDILLTHMQDDLGLPDDQIESFLKNEPLNLKPTRDPIYDRWIPGVDKLDKTPLIIHVLSDDGVKSIHNRLLLRFEERYDEPTQPVEP